MWYPRKPAFLLVGVGLSLASLAAEAAATNTVKPPNNTPVTIAMGKTFAITVGGSGGCLFDVNGMSSDNAVVTVPPASLQKSSHLILLTPVAPGTATITLTTANGSSPGCQGSAFTFPVTVTPNLTAAILNAKVKYVLAGKDLKTNLILIHFGTDLVYDQIGDDLQAGLVTPTDALQSGLEATADAFNAMTVATQEALRATMDEISTRSATFGFDASTMPVKLLPGGCGDWDKFQGLVSLGYLKALADMHKDLKLRVKAFDAFVKNTGHEGAVVMIPSPTVSLSPPQVLVSPPTPPAAPPKALRVTWSASGRLAEDANSRLVIGGLADPGAGDVTVTVTGPNAFNQVGMASVDVNERWKISLADVPPGSYVISADQGSGAETRTHQVR